MTARPRPRTDNGGDGGYIPPEFRERYEKSPGTKCPGAVLRFLPDFGLGRYIRLVAVGCLQNVIVGPIALGHIREQNQPTGMIGNVLLVGLASQQSVDDGNDLGTGDFIVGVEGAVAVAYHPAIPGGVSIDSLTMTSDQAYPVEFIQVAGSGNRILNCDIYGPEQPGDSSTWVVNRGFVTQLDSTELLVRGCIFHSLRQPAYLNPGSTGTIMDNVCYNTRGYVVDGADFLFSGNSWGLPANAVDIALLAGTVSGAPYDPLSALEASNSSATISDQR